MKSKLKAPLKYPVKETMLTMHQSAEVITVA